MDGLQQSEAQNPYVLVSATAPNSINQSSSTMNEEPQQPIPRMENPSVFEEVPGNDQRIRLGSLLPVPNHLDTFKLHYRFKKHQENYWQMYLSDSDIDVSTS